MRTTRILTAVTALFLMGATPVVSLNVPRAVEEHDPAVCAVAKMEAGAISLVGSQGVFGVVLLSAPECRG